MKIKIPISMTDADWLQRLSPLPKKIEIYGTMTASPEDIVVVTVGKDVWSRRTAIELSEWLSKCTKKKIPVMADAAPAGKTGLYLVGESRKPQFNAEFAAPFFADFNFDPGFQPYRMVTLPGSAGLVIQGLAPEGVYWGMKTLKQLLEASGTAVILPRVNVVDGADLEERGIWTQAFSKEMAPYTDKADLLAYYKEWIDWLSDHKMNLVEVVVVGEGGGISFRSRKHPEFQHADFADREYLLRELVVYGELRGVRMIPIFSHGEHYDFVGRKFPELVPKHGVMHHGHNVKLALDFFNPGTAEVYAELAEELVQAVQPRGLCFWLSENRLHSLPPGEQTASEFRQEAEVFQRVFKTACQSKPGLEMRILLSQGSYPENLDLIRAFPKDVKWIFYSGERYGTYNIRPLNPINRDIATAAREGHWISLCNSMRGVPGRPTVIETVHRNIGNAIRAGLRGLDGMSYAFPGDEMSLFVAGEHAWNWHGRTLAQTFQSFAAFKNVADPEKQGQAYYLFDRANFAQASRDSIGVGQPFGNFSRFFNMLQRIQGNDKVDELMMFVADNMEVDDLPALAGAGMELQQALSMADPEKDDLFRYRCEYLLHVLAISTCISRAFYMNCREKCWDLYKGDWSDFRSELRARLNDVVRIAAAAAPVYLEIVRREKWSKSTLEGNCPLSATAELAADIDVTKVTTSSN
jgi:hypothetical protein